MAKYLFNTQLKTQYKLIINLFFNYKNKEENKKAFVVIIVQSGSI